MVKPARRVRRPLSGRRGAPPAGRTLVRFRVDLGRAAAVGPGKIALLERIARGGSLAQAARELKMSYRRAWQLLESLNQSFLTPVALTAKGGRGGGGAVLTPLGHELVRIYRQFDGELQQQAAHSFRTLIRRTRRPST